MKLARLLWLSIVVGVTMAPLTLNAQPAGRITGVGGLFVRSKDPKALAAWYRDVLGIAVEPWGGAMLRYDAPGHPPAVVWNAFRQSSDYMAPLDARVHDQFRRGRSGRLSRPAEEKRRRRHKARRLRSERELRVDRGPRRHQDRAVAAGGEIGDRRGWAATVNGYGVDRILVS